MTEARSFSKLPQTTYSNSFCFHPLCVANTQDMRWDPLVIRLFEREEVRRKERREKKKRGERERGEERGKT